MVVQSSNGNTRTNWEICSKLAIKKPEQHHNKCWLRQRNLSHFICAQDGKHTCIQCPLDAGV